MRRVIDVGKEGRKWMHALSLLRLFIGEKVAYELS